MKTTLSPCPVTPGTAYVVTALEGEVTVAADGITLCTVSSGAQKTFVSPAGVTEVTIAGSANVQSVFKGAPALGGDGGSSSPKVEPLAPTATLKHGGIYAVAQDGDLDLSGLTVAENATAYIRLTADGVGNITWPASWTWGADSFDHNAESPVLFTDLATLEAGVVNFIAVQKTPLGVIATVSYTEK